MTIFKRTIIEDEGGIPASVDDSTESLQTVSYSHHEIHGGSHYNNELTVDMPADDVVDVRFVTPNTTKWLHFIMQLQSQEEAQITLYETITITNAGTSLTAFNNNRNSANTSGLTAFDYIINTDLTAANADTDITGATAIMGPIILGSSQGSIEGSVRGDAERVLKQNTGYCLRIENNISSLRYITWFLSWYEHTDKN